MYFEVFIFAKIKIFLKRLIYFGVNFVAVLKKEQSL